MSRRNRTGGGLVWSSDHGEMCPGCEQPRVSCQCDDPPTPASAGGVVRIQRETKGRKGKGVTLVCDLPLAGDELRDLVRELKKTCGSGGTLKDGVVEIQGDHRERLVALLEEKGFAVRRVGG